MDAPITILDRSGIGVMHLLEYPAECVLQKHERHAPVEDEAYALSCSSKVSRTMSSTCFRTWGKASVM